MATCRWCGARIAWVLLPNGKKMPLDADPDRERGRVVMRGGYGSILAGTDLERARQQDVPLYVPHHATCRQLRDDR